LDRFSIRDGLAIRISFREVGDGRAPGGTWPVHALCVAPGKGYGCESPKEVYPGPGKSPRFSGDSH